MSVAIEKVSNINHVKKVYFSVDTKEETDTREHVVLYHKLVTLYFSENIKTAFDIYRIIDKKKHSTNVLLHYFLHEARILQSKLEILKRDETFERILEEYFEKNPQKPQEHDVYWDSRHFYLISLKKKKRGIALIRQGHRKMTEKLHTEHLPFLENLIKLLEDTLEIAKNINENTKK